MSASNSFQDERRAAMAAQGADTTLRALSRDWFLRACAHRYHYNFTSLGQPIIQFPQDIVAVQELLWQVRPDLVIETGIAHGGSLMLSAGILHLLGGDGRVVGIDCEIRPHNLAAIDAHPLRERMVILEGSSTAESIAAEVRRLAADSERVMVILDADHTHAHVSAELTLYAPLVTCGSYLIVFDTVIEEMPADLFGDREWGPGNNPATAVATYLATTDRFVVDHELDAKLLISCAPGGYLRCVGDRT